MSTAGNDDKSPLIDLISCIVCNQTMRLEKSSPDAEGIDIIQYRCDLCNRIEQVRLLRRSRDSTDGSSDLPSPSVSAHGTRRPRNPRSWGFGEGQLAVYRAPFRRNVSLVLLVEHQGRLEK